MLRDARAADEAAARLPDVARALARGTAAGLPLVEAFARGADAVDGPARTMMEQCAESLRSGASTHVALRPLAELSGGSLLVGAIELHQELGGDLVASLSGIAEGLADRERLRLEARAATAQALIAARIVPLAPAASLLMLLVIAPSSAQALLSSRPGLMILGVAGALTVVAIVLLRRISRGAGL